MGASQARLIALLTTANRTHCVTDELDDMEAVQGHLRVGQMFVHAAQEGLTHIASNVENLLRVHPFSAQESREFSHGRLSLPFRNEDHLCGQ